MIKIKKLTFSKTDVLVIATVIIFSIIYALMSIVKHNSFQTFGWDLAVFDHGIWQWAHFKIPYSSFHDLPWLADHFHLILITLAPFYWIWSDVRVLLIVQAFLVSFGALPLYYLSKKVTKNNLFSFVAVLGYLLFYSLQSFIFSDFHELAYLPFTLGSIMLFWELRKTYLYWISFVLALLVKEEIGNSTYFYYNYNNRLAIKFIEYMLSLEEKEFPKWLIVLLHSLSKFKIYIQLGLVFGSSIKTKEFHDIDVLLMYDANKTKEVKKIKEGIRKSGLVAQPIRYIDITEKDILLNKEDKIFYNVISDSLIFHNPEKYVGVVRKCRR